MAPVLSAEVRVFEHLLEFGVATAEVSGVDESPVAQASADESWRRRDTMRIGARPDRVYLFDPESGERIR